MTRSKAQREQDRADLLAVLADAAEPMWTEHVIATAYGRRPGQYPSPTEASRGYSDLRALERQGQVVCERRNTSYSARWSLVADGALTRRELDEDERDVARQMSSWAPVDEEATP